MAPTVPSSSFRTAESLDFSLLLIDQLQRSPRHIPRDVAQPIRRFEICRLHQRVDVGHLKHTVLLSNSHTIASFWGRHAGSGIHWSSSHPLLRGLPATREEVYRYSYSSQSGIARIIILNLTLNNNRRGNGEPHCGISG